jgi:hypothetical protein
VRRRRRHRHREKSTRAPSPRFDRRSSRVARRASLARASLARVARVDRSRRRLAVVRARRSTTRRSTAARATFCRPPVVARARVSGRPRARLARAHSRASAECLFLPRPARSTRARDRRRPGARSPGRRIAVRASESSVRGDGSTVSESPPTDES